MTKPRIEFFRNAGSGPDGWPLPVTRNHLVFVQPLAPTDVTAGRIDIVAPRALFIQAATVIVDDMPIRITSGALSADQRRLWIIKQGETIRIIWHGENINE